MKGGGGHGAAFHGAQSMRPHQSRPPALETGSTTERQTQTTIFDGWGYRVALAVL